jgi:hypothetical protein
VIYVARQLGHAASLTLSTYGQTIDELEDRPSLSAEQAIRAAHAGDVRTAFGSYLRTRAKGTRFAGTYWAPRSSVVRSAIRATLTERFRPRKGTPRAG